MDALALLSLLARLETAITQLEQKNRDLVEQRDEAVARLDEEKPNG